MKKLEVSNLEAINGGGGCVEMLQWLFYHNMAQLNAIWALIAQGYVFTC